MDASNSQFDEKPAPHEHQPRLNEVAQKFLADLDEERQRLSAEFPLCALLIDEAVDRVYCTFRKGTWIWLYPPWTVLCFWMAP
ncbi:hypothetical protein ACLKA6_001972 [Drosophila palustris]